MAFSIRSQPSTSVLNPGETEGSLYVNEAGKLVVRLSDGSEKEAQTPDGNPIFLENQATDPTAQTNKFRVFSKLANNAANLHVIAPDGTVIQLTGDGGLVGGGGGAFFAPIIGQTEATFTAAVVNFETTWDTGLHFVIPDNGWSLVPVWVEFFVTGNVGGVQTSGGTLFVFVFEPGPGTPQSRAYSVNPYQDGRVSQFFQVVSYSYTEGTPFYNHVVNGDELQAGFNINVSDGDYLIHARAIMGGAVAIQELVAPPPLP